MCAPYWNDLITKLPFENYLILTQEQNDERTMLYHVQYIDLATWVE